MQSSIHADGAERGFYDGKILIAMPGLDSGMFTRSVVYICAHSEAGAMGFIINRKQELSFPEVLLHLKLVQEENLINLSDLVRDLPVQCGGPVETARGLCCTATTIAAAPACLSATISRCRQLWMCCAQYHQGRGQKRRH